MSVIECKHGHFYDEAKYAECPHCVGPTSDKDQDDVMVASVESKVNAHVSDRLAAYSKYLSAGGTGLRGGEIEPVVGWLVCVQGAERGRDYRIHAGQNFIGRSFGMDVAVIGDEQISREKHCVIVYDPGTGNYHLVHGEGTDTYLNDDLLAGYAVLKNRDQITIGASEFIFVPLCEEGFQWS
jgi:hypothetical protein